MNKNIKDISKEELKQIYSVVEDEIDIMLTRINEKTGYFANGLFSILADDIKKSLEVDMNISLLERPHTEDQFKVRHYVKNNPDNVLNKPILAYKNNSWYMIYDGVHRTASNKEKGNKTIKTNIILPKPKD